jgi:2Fe-2S ferredoxin
MHITRAACLPVSGEYNGSMACATCHVIVDPDWAPRLPPPNTDETAMLETLFEPAVTSRLGCQIRLGPGLDGLRLVLPG